MRRFHVLHPQPRKNKSRPAMQCTVAANARSTLHSGGPPWHGTPSPTASERHRKRCPHETQRAQGRLTAASRPTPTSKRHRAPVALPSCASGGAPPAPRPRSRPPHRRAASTCGASLRWPPRSCAEEAFLCRQKRAFSAAQPEEPRRPQEGLALTKLTFTQQAALSPRRLQRSGTPDQNPLPQVLAVPPAPGLGGSKSDVGGLPVGVPDLVF